MKRKPLNIPPTKNHRQLAAWINRVHLVDNKGRTVVATVERRKYNTDRHPKGVRYRIEGRGRWGLVFEIWLLARTEPVDHWHDHNRLYSHNSGETYRKHEEARRWVTENLSVS